jgi:endonuclease YncB( thermonuclease family)
LAGNFESSTLEPERLKAAAKESGSPPETTAPETGYGRRLQIVEAANDDDLGALLIRKRWALAHRRYSVAYVGQEQAAKSAGRGIWRGEFVAPWD